MTQDTLTTSPESSPVIEPRTAITVTATADAPLTPYTHIRRFNHTGGVQDFTVPPGVTTIDARCWGGGGGGADTGGGGGFVTGSIAVVPGETLRVVVDLGGGTGSGGGMSGLYSQRLGETLLIAGGGGSCTNTSAVHARGGAGGGINGSPGQPESRGGRPGTPAGGASGSTGGAGGTVEGLHGGRGGDTGEDGGSSPSGAGGQVPIEGMGGGGGGRQGGGTGGGAGYAGGGGGVSDFYPSRGYASGGGGGSSFTGGPGVTAGRTVAGSGTRAGAKDDPLYQSPAGNPDHQVTVMGAGGSSAYMGTLSADGQSLTFTDVDLDIPSEGAETVLYVCVSAADDAPAGDTHLEFTIGTQTSPSTPIHVT
ncbi:hypothetical protein [Streptomyces flaveolus]|uniref:hypothetical protein n=1 Tax=Streptomyces flaveolus TaxID=67297 RepID=UPI0036FF5B3E